MSDKLKISMFWAAACGGCDISLLEIGPHLVDLVAVADVAFWPCAADFKYEHVRAWPDGYLDVAFYNGSVRNSEQEEVARLLRRKARTLVAYGSCAIDGGIPALANLVPLEEIMQRAYVESESTTNPEGVLPQPLTPTEFGELEIPEMYEQVLRLTDVVDVDYQIPGCPPQADQVWKVIQAVASGAVPARNEALKVGCDDRSVCEECSLEKRQVRIQRFHRPHSFLPEPGWCLLEQGVICLGPATRSGCGALCLEAGLPCRGCYGPSGKVVDQGTAMISAVASLLDATEEEHAQQMLEEVVDLVGTFYRFSLSSSFLKSRRPS